MSQEPTMSQEPEIIASKDGKPFDTERAAVFSLEKKGLKGKYEVTASGAGFVLRKIPAGNEDSDNKTSSSTQDPEPSKGKQKEKVYWVEFAAKTDKYQTDDVCLTCNGDTIVIQRQKKIPLPQRFLEIADHAQYPVFTQKPNEPRKIVSYVSKYPYHSYGEATMDDFIKMRDAGTRKTEENLKMQGLSVDKN